MNGCHVGHARRWRVLVSTANALATGAAGLALCGAARARAQMAAADSSAMASGTSSMLMAVRPAVWWPELASWDDLATRRVFVASLWKNTSDMPLDFQVVYTAYSQNGTPAGSCQSDVEAVPPGVSAWAVCAPTTGTASTLRHHPPQITTRLTLVTADTRRRLAATVEKVGAVKDRTFAGVTEFGPWAQIKVGTPGDVRAKVLFHLLAEDGSQVAACDAWAEPTLQSEVAVRVATDPNLCATLPRHRLEMHSVTVELLEP